MKIKKLNVKIKVSSIKVDQKMAHLVANTEGCKSDCACVNCRCPKKYGPL